MGNCKCFSALYFPPRIGTYPCHRLHQIGVLDTVVGVGAEALWQSLNFLDFSVEHVKKRFVRYAVHREQGNVLPVESGGFECPPLADLSMGRISN